MIKTIIRLNAPDSEWANEMIKRGAFEIDDDSGEAFSSFLITLEANYGVKNPNISNIIFYLNDDFGATINTGDTLDIVGTKSWDSNIGYKFVPISIASSNSPGSKEILDSNLNLLNVDNRLISLKLYSKTFADGGGYGIQEVIAIYDALFIATKH